MTGSWLFVRGNESIWLQRTAEDRFELDMHGPLSLRRRCSFETAEALGAFLHDVESRLTLAGWWLQRFGPGDDRRRARTASPPGTFDRRGAASVPPESGPGSAA